MTVSAGQNFSEVHYQAARPSKHDVGMTGNTGASQSCFPRACPITGRMLRSVLGVLESVGQPLEHGSRHEEAAKAGDTRAQQRAESNGKKGDREPKKGRKTFHAPRQDKRPILGSTMLRACN